VLLATRRLKQAVQELVGPTFEAFGFFTLEQWEAKSPEEQAEASAHYGFILIQNLGGLPESGGGTYEGEADMDSYPADDDDYG